MVHNYPVFQKASRFLLRFSVFALAGSAFCQTSPAPAWSGQVQCQLNDQDGNYNRQETQTWVLAGGGPISPTGMPVYNATWTATGYGTLQKVVGAQTINSQWTANVAATPATINIFVRASDRRLIIKPWHSQLSVFNAVNGTRQIAVNGVAQPPAPFSHTAWEWQFPRIEDSGAATSVSGSSQSQADAGDAELNHHIGGLPPNASCQWRFTQGGGASPTSTPAGSNTGTTTPANSSQNCQSAASIQQSFEAMKVDIKSQYDKLIQSTTDPVEIASLTGQEQKTLAGLNTQEQRDVQQATTTCSGTPSTGGSQTQPGSSTPGSSGGGTPQAPPPPTNVTATAGDGSATITWAAPILPTGISVSVYRIGPISGGAATTSPTSPVTISGLMNGTTYTFQVVAVSNMGGPAAYSAPAVSNAVVPAVPGTVNPSGPAITSISPNQGTCNANNSFQLNARNTHFAAGATTADFGPGVQQKALNVVSPQQLFAHLFIHGGAAPGLHTVTITTGAEVVTTAFTVIAPCTSNPAPGSLQSLTPNTGAQGAQNIPVQLTADANTYFVAGLTTADFGPGITSTFTVNSSSTATAYLNIAPTATIGTHDVTLNTAGELNTLAQGFTVTAATGPPDPGGITPLIPILAQPRFKSVSAGILVGAPPATSNGMTTVPVTLTGQLTNFAQGATTVSFVSAQAAPATTGRTLPKTAVILAAATAPVQVTQVHVNAANSAIATISIDPTKAAGTYNIVVTTPLANGSEVVTLNNAFTITLAPPVATPLPSKLAGGIIAKTTPPASASASYLVTITGLLCLQNTRDDIFNRDGKGDEVYAATYVEQYDRNNGSGALSSYFANTWVYGDTSTPGTQRQQAGSLSSSGGITAGNYIPDGTSPQGKRTLTPLPTTFPELLWQGTLTDGVDVILLSPSVWESDSEPSVYNDWTQKINNLGNANSLFNNQKVADQIKNQVFGPLVLGTTEAIPSGAIVGIINSTFGLLPIQLLFQGGRDRPIGLISNDVNTLLLPNTMIVLTREIIENKLLRENSWATATITFADSQKALAGVDAPGTYLMFLQVERTAGTAGAPADPAGPSAAAGGSAGASADTSSVNAAPNYSSTTQAPPGSSSTPATMPVGTVTQIPLTLSPGNTGGAGTPSSTNSGSTTKPGISHVNNRTPVGVQSAGASCRSSITTQCGSACVILSTDVNHCGACGNLCPTEPRIAQ